MALVDVPFEEAYQIDEAAIFDASLIADDAAHAKTAVVTKVLKSKVFGPPKSKTWKRGGHAARSTPGEKVQGTGFELDADQDWAKDPVLKEV